MNDYKITNMDELLEATAVIDEMLAEVAGSVECAGTCETMADVCANLRDAAKAARELADECERVAKSVQVD